jgi:hypothetical protein
MITIILLGYLLGFTGLTGIYACSARSRQAEEASNAGVLADMAGLG